MEHPQLYNGSPMRMDMGLFKKLVQNALEWSFELALDRVGFGCFVFLSTIPVKLYILLHLNSRLLNKKQKHSDWNKREGERRNRTYSAFILILWDCLKLYFC